MNETTTPESNAEAAGPVDPLVSLHFNQLTPAEAERLAVLAEEMGEAIQAIGKVLRHGYESTHPYGGPTNRTTLEREIGDVLYVIDRMVVHDLSAINIDDAKISKAHRVKKYLHHAG